MNGSSWPLFSLLGKINQWREGKIDKLIDGLLYRYNQRFPESYLVFRSTWLKSRFFNLPNSISLLRMIAILPLLVLLEWQDQYGLWPAIILFSLMALTDTLDGAIARVSNCQTNWGCFIDPLADKLLIILVMVIQNQHHQIILTNLIWLTAMGETLYTLMRLIRLICKLKPYGSNYIGKTKFFLQVLVVIMLILKAPWAFYANLMLLMSLLMLYYNISTGLFLIGSKLLFSKKSHSLT